MGSVILSLSFLACSTLGDRDPVMPDTETDSSGGVYGYLGDGGDSSGDGGSNSSDGGDTDGDGGADIPDPDDGGSADGGSSDGGFDPGDGGGSELEIQNVRVWVDLDPAKVAWDAIVTDPSTTHPEFEMWPLSSSEDWDYGYGNPSGDVGSTSTSADWVYQEGSYTLGDTVYVGGEFHDGWRERYLTEYGCVVNIAAGSGGLQWVLFELLDDDGDSTGVVQAYPISGSAPDAVGEAGCEPTETGGDVVVFTWEHANAVSTGY